MLAAKMQIFLTIQPSEFAIAKIFRRLKWHGYPILPGLPE
jgi:hypothetical protein